MDLDGIYSGKHIALKPVFPVAADDLHEEKRYVRGTKCCFIGDFEKILEIKNDTSVYSDLCNKATVRVANPDYLDFDVYTKRILNDPLSSLDQLESLSPELAKKYMEYGIKYDKDKKYSDKLIVKSYFASCDSGVLILTDDFVDVNLELQISETVGVVSCELWISESTSHYLDYYKDI